MRPERGLIAGQGHALLRYDVEKSVLMRLPVIAFVFCLENEGFGWYPPDARAASGHNLHDSTEHVYMAVATPNGLVVDSAGDLFDGEDAWLADCHRRRAVAATKKRG